MNGDLIINVRVKKHPTIRREANSAVSDMDISVIDAVLGCKKTVETIYGEKKEIQIQAGVQNGQRVRLANEGFHLINSSQKGDHYVIVKIKIPKNVSAEEKELYEKLKQIESGAKKSNSKKEQTA